MLSFLVILVLIPKPRSVIVVNVTSDMATVQWEGISSDDASQYGLCGYKIIISGGNISFNVTATGNISQVVLRNLSSNTTYFVKVLGYHEYGEGLTSDRHYFTTLGGYTKPLPFIQYTSIQLKFILKVMKLTFI